MNTGLTEPFKMLCSYAYFRPKNLGHILDNRLFVKDLMVFGDSGAHSARTLGIDLTLEDYAAWCHRWDSWLTLYASLDVIGAPEGTWNNHQALRRDGLTPIPVFHTGTPWPYLERYIDQGHTYIALGKLLGNPVDTVIPWLAKVFEIADGRAVFHGFGMTVWRVLREFPFYSVDSSTWNAPRRWGYVSLFDDGRWVKVALRDRVAVLKHRDLFRAHYADPAAFASRATQARLQSNTVAMFAWRRAEEYLRAHHGPITIPDSPYNPAARTPGQSAPPGLHLYLADSTTTHFEDATKALHTTRALHQEQPA